MFFNGSYSKQVCTIKEALFVRGRRSPYLRAVDRAIDEAQRTKTKLTIANICWIDLADWYNHSHDVHEAQRTKTAGAGA